MAAFLTIVGSRDAQLEELVRASGRISTVTWAVDLSALIDRQGQPARCAARRRAQLRPGPRRAGDTETAASDHQRRAARLGARSSADARGHARRRQRVHRRAAESGDFDAAIARLLGQRKQVTGGPVFAFVGAKGGVGTTTTAVNVATALAKLCQGPDAARRPAPGLRRCGRLPRRRRAVLAARRAREHAPARRRVPEEPGGQDRLRPRAAGVCGSSGRTGAVDMRRLGSVVQLAASQYAYTVLDVPRSDLDRARQSRSGRRISSSSRTRSSPPSAMPDAWRRRFARGIPTRRSRPSSTAPIGNAEIGQRDVEKAVGGAIAHQFPE